MKSKDICIYYPLYFSFVIWYIYITRMYFVWLFMFIRRQMWRLAATISVWMSTISDMHPPTRTSRLCVRSTISSLTTLFIEPYLPTEPYHIIHCILHFHLDANYNWGICGNIGAYSVFDLHYLSVSNRNYKITPPLGSFSRKLQVQWIYTCEL